MQKIVCTFDDYDRFCAVFQKMYFKAAGFVPTVEELEQMILPDLKNYILFLLWIMETGTETEENAAMRKRIARILNEHLELVEETEQEA